MPFHIVSLIQKTAYLVGRHGFSEAARLAGSFAGRRARRFWERCFFPQPGLLPCPTEAARQGSAAVESSRNRPGYSGPHAACRCHFGEKTDFGDQVTVVVAHSDPQAMVDPYVLHLCRHFRSLGWRVIVVSTSGAPASAFSGGWADAALSAAGPGGCFFCWQAALRYFPSLLKCRQLVFCSDKVFGPLGSFAAAHKRMERLRCDVWGLTAQRRGGHAFLRGHYLVCNPPALGHGGLPAFFEENAGAGMRHDDEAAVAGLCRHLCRNGLRVGVFCLPPGHDVRGTRYSWRRLLDAGVPLLAHEELYSGEHNIWGSKGAALRAAGYPLSLLDAYFWRMGRDFSPCCASGKRYGHFPPDVRAMQCPVDLATFSDTASSGKGLAVVLHCYYPDLFHELRPYLKNLPCDAHVYLSTDTEEKRQSLVRYFGQTAFDRVDVRVFPNRGWDIAPFLVGFKDVLPQYELVLKIHIKGSAQHALPDVKAWRSLMYSSLMGNSRRVNQLVQFFAAAPELGMLAPPVPSFLKDISQSLNHVVMQRLLRKYGISLPRDAAIDFPAGSMFWARTAALRPWTDLALGFEDFEDSADSPRDGTLAHSLERLFFFGCGIANMRWGRLAPPPYDAMKREGQSDAPPPA